MGSLIYGAFDGLGLARALVEAVDHPGLDGAERAAGHRKPGDVGIVAECEQKSVELDHEAGNDSIEMTHGHPGSEAYLPCAALFDIPFEVGTIDPLAVTALELA